MPMNGKLATFGLVTLFVIAPALSAEPAAPMPPAELDQLKKYQGDWICTGEVPKGPLGPARKTSTSVSFKTDLDGMWISGQVAEAASAENPHAYRGTAYMTYDAAAKSFITLWVDNTGGWAHQTSKGWQQSRMVWLGEGALMGSKVTARDTFTDQGPALKHVGELQIDGKWTLVQNEICKPKAEEKK